MDSSADIAATTPVVDARQPWLGLASFTEETRAYFHGREDEIAELARRVQRKLLTVLFGKSGLGKTSILRAGVVPRLRGEGFCPIYVRIDYGPDAPPPAEQIKQAIYRTAQAAGQWSQPGVAQPDESPWEFLHHRDDVLRDANGEPLIPLLIFDQFEEVFTLAQSDAAGRDRAARFLEDLADLVENRPPRALEARFEEDDAWAEQFDFARSDYRVLISLREDYLANLEGLKANMPSVTQNRMRLAPMTGEQALAAVTGPGGALVTPEVAAAIVRFVAGGAELRNAEVEPSLLSLICRELNDARLAEGRPEISLDLLEGSRTGILAGFYERVLADQPAAVRQVIEDQLLTGSGYRENVAEERLLRDFSAAGAAPGTLAVLVDRRLLRIEERLDVRRVELTHDVLCDVVRASRDRRQEREARDAAERQLSLQRERERSARKALVRARQVAAVCIVLAVGAVAASVFAFYSSRRAQLAEEQASVARVQAEKLIGYITEDFVRELEPVGKRNVISDLDEQVVRYYRGLPAQLQGLETEQGRALALVAYGTALERQSKLAEADVVISEAIATLEKRIAVGDHAEAVTIGLARGLVAKADIDGGELAGDPLAMLQRAAALLAPLVAAGNASPAALMAHGEVLSDLGYHEYDSGEKAEAAITYERAMQDFAAIGARDLSNPAAASRYVQAAAWRVDVLGNLGQVDPARTLGAEAVRISSELLDRQPGHLTALYARALARNFLAGIESTQGALARAQALLDPSIADWRELARLDPSNQTARNNLGATLATQSFALEASGQLRRAAETFLQASTASRDAQSKTAFTLRNEIFGTSNAARLLADLGDFPGSSQALALGQTLQDEALHDASFHGKVPDDVTCVAQWGKAWVASARDHLEEMRDVGRRILAATRARAAAGDNGAGVAYCTFYGATIVGEALWRLGDDAAARSTLQDLLGSKAFPRQSDTDARLMRATSAAQLALILVRQGEVAEARQRMESLVAFLRGQEHAVREDKGLEFSLATALYANAMADPAHRAALLHEAADRLAGLPSELRHSHSVALWRKMVDTASR